MEYFLTKYFSTKWFLVWLILEMLEYLKKIKHHHLCRVVWAKFHPTSEACLHIQVPPPGPFPPPISFWSLLQFTPSTSMGKVCKFVFLLIVSNTHLPFLSQVYCSLLHLIHGKKVSTVWFLLIASNFSVLCSHVCLRQGLKESRMLWLYWAPIIFLRSFDWFPPLLSILAWVLLH